MTNSTSSALPLVILDQGASWQEGATRIVHWATMDVPPGHDSLPLLVDQQAAVLRREYLAWVHELGEYRVKGASVKLLLRFSNDTPFYWLTSSALRFPFSSAVFTIFKLRGMEKLYAEHGCRGIVLCSSNRQLHRVLSRWCRHLGHPYSWRPLPGTPRPRRSWRERCKSLPYPFQALGTLARRLWMRWELRSAAPVVPHDDHQVMVFTDFPNFDLSQAQQGRFRSHYWGQLHDLLDRGPWRINWIWRYVRTPGYSLAEAVAWQRRFQARGKRESYYILEQFLTARAVVEALTLFLRLAWRRLSLQPVRQAFQFPGSCLNFWPVMANDWDNSLSGPEAMENCLDLTIFRALARALPAQQWGLYLWENIPWERALLMAWKSCQAGKLIGFQHAALYFLDLRFFEDPRSYGALNGPPPLPDVLAVNGRGPYQLLADAGVPLERLALVEAVRYTYLSRAVGAKQPIREPETNVPSTLLVVTGILVSETAAQLRLLNQASTNGVIAGYDEIIIKPHPGCAVEDILSREAPHLQARIVHVPLPSLWRQAAAVYISNYTSASVEAALLRLPVLVHVMEDSFNFSPLRGQVGVRHVGTVGELRRGLAAAEPANLSGNYFCLEANLPRWRRLLGMEKIPAVNP